ncbi:MAG TPA: SDR family oxidoreductase [Chthoniobacterales bacterium]
MNEKQGHEEPAEAASTLYLEPWLPQAGPGSLTGKIALVTGASRGIGARVAEFLAAAGADVAVNYRSKSSRAETVVETLQGLGRRALAVQADLTVEADVQRLAETMRREWGMLHLLVLNASGGLEKDQPPDYSLRLNRDAQLSMVQALLPSLPRGARVIFVTSHLAHFFGKKPVYAGYEPVARGKQAGEQALRALQPDFEARGIMLIVVSGDMIDGTITPKLLDRQNRGLIHSRREAAGTLPTVAEFARAIVDACAAPGLSGGNTVYVGTID